MGDDCLDISYEPLVFGSHSLSVCLARGFQENWNSLGYDLFLLPLVSGSHLFGVGVQDYGLFWDMISGNAVSSASWFDSGYMLLPVYGFLVYFSVFIAMLGSQWSTLCASHRVYVVDFPVVVQRPMPMVLLFSRP